MLAQKSKRYILPPLLIGLFFLLVYPIVGLIFLAIALYLTWFFRDPHRVINLQDDLILAAADGKVILKEISNDSIKIAIRMSPFNVHINRAPINGNVATIEHTPGSHSNVYFGDIENKNERNLIKIIGPNVECEILQITGSFARRIECWIEKGKGVQQGQKIGMIRFGSQTNMYIHAIMTDKSIKPLVNLGDKVYAGITAVAKIEGIS